MTRPTIKELYTGRAGFLWNAFCCPFCCTFGLVWRSLSTLLFPCVSILLQRLMVGFCWMKICFCIGWPYEDDTFFGSTALGDDDDGGKSGKELEKETDWVRAQDLKQFKGQRPQLFEGKIEPSDLCQGAIGDCWLVAAMACGSEFPDMIRQMFVTKEYNPRGKYNVRIYDPQLKTWVIVTVDDRIPCMKGTIKPRFMKPNGNELWAIILEKAYAKHCGSYANLSGGFVLWGWLTMTGDHVFQMSKKGNDWQRQDMVAKASKTDKRACSFFNTQEKYNDDELWTLLKKYDKQKALMSASIGKNRNADNDGPAGEQYLKDEGLVAGHAYSVISAMDVTETLLGGGKSFRLLRLRNPWGSYEWKGDWSDKSDMWTKYDHIAKKCGHTNDDDGSFWMEFNDFKKVFTRINVCDRDTSRDTSLDVNEDDGGFGIITGFFSSCAKFWCLCQGVRNLYFSHESTHETLGTNENTCWIC